MEQLLELESSRGVFSGDILEPDILKSQVATHAGASLAVCRVFAEAIHVLYDIIWVYGAAPRRLRVGSKRIRALKSEAGTTKVVLMRLSRHAALGARADL